MGKRWLVLNRCSLTISMTSTRDSLGLNLEAACCWLPMHGEEIWVSESENLELYRPFTEDEVEFAIKLMNINSVPSPDGFSILFFGKKLGNLKHQMMHIFHDLHRGTLQVHRIKFGVLTLIPKIPSNLGLSHFRMLSLRWAVKQLLTLTRRMPRALLREFVWNKIRLN